MTTATYQCMVTILLLGTLFAVGLQTAVVQAKASSQPNINQAVGYLIMGCASNHI